MRDGSAMFDATPLPRLLILGGSTEAGALARAVAEGGRWNAVLSLAGRTREPGAAALPVRVGGFGGAEGLAAWLRREGVRVVVDATHPFAARMGENARRAAAACGARLLRVERPAWVAGPGDRWTAVADLEAAAEALGPLPRRVLLTTGREMGPFLRRPWHRYRVRCIEPPPALPEGAELLLDRGPFTPEGERAVLRGMDVLVSKNGGGGAVAAKLGAARGLGVEVVMVARPARPGGEVVADVAGAVGWLEGAIQGLRP